MLDIRQVMWLLLLDAFTDALFIISDQHHNYMVSQTLQQFPSWIQISFLVSFTLLSHSLCVFFVVFAGRPMDTCPLLSLICASVAISPKKNEKKVSKQ